MDSLPDSLFNAVFNHLPQPCILLRVDSPRFTIVADNTRYKQIAPGQDITGNSFSELFTTGNSTPDGTVLLHNALQKAIEINKVVKSPLVQYSPTNASQSWWQFEFLPVTDGTGAVAHILVSMLADNETDKHQQLQNEQVLNEELTSTNEELISTNEELQQARQNLAKANDDLERNVENRTKALALSEAKFRSFFEQSPIALCVLSGRNLIIESANENILAIWDKGIDVVGQPLAVVLPELHGQPFFDILDEVFITGIPYRAYDMRAVQLHNGKPTEVFVDFVYSPIEDDTGEIVSIMVSAIDVTEKAIIRQSEQQLNEELTAGNEELTSINEELLQSQLNLQSLNAELESRVERRTKSLADSEARFRSIIAQAPLGIALFSGPQHIVEIVNDNQLKFWGKNKKVIGKPHQEVTPVPGVNEYGSILQNVFKSGFAFKGYEVPVTIEPDGVPIKRYFNFIYEPLKDENGQTQDILLIADDVTETVLSKKDLEKAQDLLNLSIEATELGTWSADMVTGEMTMSARTHQIRGDVDDQVVTLTNSVDVIIPEHRNRFREAVYQAIADKVNFNEDMLVQPMDGSDLRWIKSMGKAYYDEQGKPLFISGAILDITEQVLSRENLQALNEELSATNEELASANEELLTSNEEIERNQQELEKLVKQLTESESKLRYMLADAPIAIALFTGRELTIDSANKKVIEAWGKDGSVIGKTLQEAVPELIGQPFLQILDDVYTSGVPYHGNEEKASIELNGLIEEFYFNYVYHPLKNENGDTTGIVLVANEVTEQVTSRKQIERAEEMMRFALDAANIGTWFLDTKTRHFIPSPRLKELFGFEAGEEVNYEDVTGQIPEDYRQKIHDAIEKSIAENGNYSMEHPVIGKHDEKLRWIRGLGRLTVDDNGELANFSGVVIDITEQKQDEMRKNDFIGMVSHELKTPLTSLSAYVQMLHGRAQKSDDSFTSNALDKANLQVKKMSNMINGFLNVSRLESGRIVLDKLDFDMVTLLKEVIAEAQLTIAGHQITMIPCQSVTINADRDKIGSVISNLLSNADKYSPNGTPIKVACMVVNGNIQISVTDEGIGVKPEDIDKLFERYYRVVTPTTKHISGFGIGLYLSAEIIERHGGKIWAESEFGKGATFYFSLPVSRG
jgi:two-component system sensor histidine kinase VicK